MPANAGSTPSGPSSASSTGVACQAASLIVPARPSPVAAARVNATEPKFASGSVRHSPEEAQDDGASSGECRTLPLANFGSVAFTRAAATGDGRAGTISDAAWQATPVELAELGPDGVDPAFAGMRPSSAASGASPGPLSADGRGFAVAWHPAPG